MGDEMKQAETGMPSLTLEPDFAPEVKKEPEVPVSYTHLTLPTICSV